MSLQLIALLSNIALAILKFTVGNIAGSRALIADALNSAGDVVTTFVAWLAFRYGRTPPDENHPYGHANAEALAGLLIGGMLTATGALIAIEGLDGLLAESGAVTVPGALALWASGITIGVKAVLYRFSIRIGRKTHSPTLLASAADHRADVVTGSVALISIALARGGYTTFDALGGIAIGIYIMILSIQPVRENLDILMWRAPDGMGERASELARSVPAVKGIRELRVQPQGGRYRMDLVLLVDGHMSVDDAHHVAHEVEDSIISSINTVTEVYVHIEPLGSTDVTT